MTKKTPTPKTSSKSVEKTSQGELGKDQLDKAVGGGARNATRPGG